MAKRITQDVEQPTASIQLKRLNRVRFHVPVEGITPLMTHKWSEKAIKEMLDKGGPAKPKRNRDQRDPTGDFEAARYLLGQPRKDGYTDGVPAVAFKAAIVAAARAFDGVTMTALKQFVYVHGEPPEMLVAIQGKPEMDVRPVRVGSGLNKTADIRSRPMYWPWRCDLTVEWPEHMFDVNSMVALVDAAGMGGICEWRPTSPQSLTGSLGQFQVVAEEVKQA